MGSNVNKIDRNYRLRTSDFDRYNRMLPATMLDMFQDMAGEHADYIGVGYDKMAEINIFWVLLRVKYEVIERPKLYTNIKASTWPHEPQRAMFVRDYQIADENGTLLVKGSSQWGLVDISTRKIIAPKDVEFEIDEYYPEKNFPEGIKKIRDFEEEEAVKGYEVFSGYTDIDINGHVNNTKYANYILNAIKLPKEEVIKTFQIDYRKEVKEGEKLIISYVRNENIITCKGCGEDGQLRFMAELTLEQA
ncbi:MAG: hypothetical protein IJW18_02510 [Lachnospiraceae bacterium]|nr:hypothetical protein [Lachnospiraceae bacterium]